MKKNIFFAFPWSPLILKTYEEIFKKHGWGIIKNIYYGSESLTAPRAEGKIEEFRNQNKQLFEIFVKNIQRSEFFVADVTNFNPNVMFELGIAIQMNKNILILTSDDSKKMPFDIQGINIQFYKNKKELECKISQYIKDYEKIKKGIIQVGTVYHYQLDRQDEITSYEDEANKELKKPPYIIKKLEYSKRVKDVIFKIDYRIIKSENEEDWFGVMLRSAPNINNDYGPIYHGSILINCRKNGEINLTLYPGEKIKKSGKIHNKNNENFHHLEISLDNNCIEIRGDNKKVISYNKLQLNNFGYIFLVSHQSRVKYKNLEIIDISTISETQ